MRRYIATVIFLILLSPSSAQEFRWGESVSLRRSSDLYNVFDHRVSDGSFLICVTTDRTITAYEYDSTLRIIRNWEYRLQRGVREIPLRFERKGDSLHILMEEYSLFGDVHIKDVAVSTNYNAVGKTLATFDFQRGYSGQLRMIRDHDHWYVWYASRSNRLSDPAMIFCYRFSENWGSQGMDTIDLGYEQRETEILDLDVEHDRYVVYTKVYEGNKVAKRGGEPNAYYALLVQPRDTLHSPVYEVRVTSDSLYYPNMRFRRKGRSVYFYGSFSVTNSDRTDGLIAGRVDPDYPGDARSRLYYLPDSLRYPGGSQVLSALAGVQWKEYRLTDYIDRGESLTYIFERRYTLATGSGGGRPLYEYYFRDLIIVRVDREGVAWTARLEKYQKTFNDRGRFSSYNLVRRDDTLVMVYNDRYSKGIFGSTRFTNPEKFALKSVVIRPDGTMGNDIVADYTMFRSTLAVRQMIHTGNLGFLVIGQRNKAIRPCMVRFGTLVD